MGIAPPEMAKTETILMRLIKKFHEKFIEKMSISSTEKLRCVAWQLDEYINENKKFKDAEFLRTLLSTVEYAIQQQGGTQWTVERAKKDLRGRTRGVNQHADKEKSLPRRRVPVSRDLAERLASVITTKE